MNVKKFLKKQVKREIRHELHMMKIQEMKRRINNPEYLDKVGHALADRFVTATNIKNILLNS